LKAGLQGKSSEIIDKGSVLYDSRGDLLSAEEN
jgi:hypothetical protein